MADDSEQAELRLLREAIKRLDKRVEALEGTQQASDPKQAANLDQAAEQPVTTLNPSNQEMPRVDLLSSKLGKTEELAPIPPKISIPPPPGELELGSPLRQEPPFISKRVGKFFGNESWESIVGECWLSWLGSGSLILAVAYFLPWAWRHYQLPGWFRVLVFHLAGLSILAAAKIFSSKKLPQLAQGVAGLGIFTLYAAAYAMHHHYRLGGELSSTITFVDCALITIGAIVIALRSNSVAVILLGALGGYLTPHIASTGSVGNTL